MTHRVATAAGSRWFKANTMDCAYEAALADALGRWHPGAVLGPLAVDAERGWPPTPARRCARRAAHDDLTDANVFPDGPTGFRFFDWGDASVSHPFGTQLAAISSAAWFLGLDTGDAALPVADDFRTAVPDWLADLPADPII